MPPAALGAGIASGSRGADLSRILDELARYISPMHPLAGSQKTLAPSPDMSERVTLASERYPPQAGDPRGRSTRTHALIAETSTNRL